MDQLSVVTNPGAARVEIIDGIGTHPFGDCVSVVSTRGGDAFHEMKDAK
jgi:hypothetical protein